MEGLRLKQFRESLEKTQKQMADYLNTPISTYNKYEQSKLRVSDDVRIALFSLGLDINWLLTGEGEMLRQEVDEKIDRAADLVVGGLTMFMEQTDQYATENRQRIEVLEENKAEKSAVEHENRALRQELEHTQERLEALQKIVHQITDEPEEAEQEAKAKLPYYGLVAAAGPLRDLDTVEETILIPESLLPQNREGLFVGRIEGDSMADIIPDEAEILLRVCSEPVSGRVYVFSLRGQATIKKFHIDHTGPHFEYMNGSGKTIYPEPGEQWYCNAEFLRAL